MLVALLADTHYGVRGDSTAFLDMTKRFMDDIFLPHIDMMGIDHIIHLGDLVDRRKIVSIETASRLRKDFIEPILNRNVAFHLILGNHDEVYKNKSSPNAPTELFGDTFPIYHKPYELTLDGEKILFVPWINKENEQESFDAIETSDALICMGHLGIEGFSMHKGGISSHGLSRSIFRRFDLVLSGHFHHRSSDDVIHYLGSHGEFTWADCDDPRGFHILDTKTKELTFVENPYRMFHKLDYDEDCVPSDLTKYKNSYVKLIVKNKTKQSTLDELVSKFEGLPVLDLQVIEEHLNLGLEESSEAVDESMSTIDIFRQHISQLDTPNLNLKKLELTMIDLYNKALTVA